MSIDIEELTRGDLIEVACMLPTDVLVAELLLRDVASVVVSRFARANIGDVEGPATILVVPDAKRTEDGTW